MTSKILLTLTFLGFLNCLALAQSSTLGMTVVTEEVSNEMTEIIKSEKKVTTRKFQKQPPKPLTLKADVWPNPSNLGKVRLSIENLPAEPLFIQIFNEREELIQEGVINGTLGASLQHTLELPSSSGTYSIKLSDDEKIVKDLELEIL